MTKGNVKQAVMWAFVICLLSCLIPGMSEAASDSAARNTDTYRQWHTRHQKVCDLMGQYKFDQALEESKPLLGYLKELNLTDSKEMFETCNNLGAINLHAKNYQEAHNLFWMAIKIAIPLFGQDSLEAGFVYKNLSQLYGDRANQIFMLHKEELGVPNAPAPAK